MSDSLFREAALAKIRSPDQLDARLSVTSPFSWLALATVFFVVVVIVVWAFAGTIMRTATGHGIILRNGDLGILSVGGSGSGPVQEILVQLGDEVQKGQALFRLDLSQLEQELESSRALLKTLQHQDELQSRDEEERLGIVLEKLVNQERLYEKGLLTKTPLLDSRALIYSIQLPRFQRAQQMIEQQAKINSLEIRIRADEFVRAPYDGEVIEVDANLGDYAQPGRVLARLQSIAGPTEALVYVPALEGKRIIPGMGIRISPSTVKPEEYGYIQGKVRRLSLFPVSREEMMTVLGDEAMVDRAQERGAAILLAATLEEDASTPSGFRWSSSKGPPIAIEGGTLCTASVVLERQKPITLLLPFLKKLFGLY